MKTAVYGNTLIITGTKKGRTTYRVTLDPRYATSSGRASDNAQPSSTSVCAAALASSGDQFVVLDPSAQAALLRLTASTIRV